VLAGAGIGLAVGVVAWLAFALVRRTSGRGASRYSRGLSAGDIPTGVAAEALVDRLEQRLAGRESALAARERDLQARIDELRALEAGRPGARDLPAGERELEVARLAARERELAEREESLAERVAAVTERELAAARAAAQQAVPAASAPLAASAPPAEVSGAFKLAELERLVAAHGAEHPDRHDEWDSTLFFLRDYAGPDGTLPGSFDWLVQDTFSLLLG
jgi:hypothetical protein